MTNDSALPTAKWMDPVGAFVCVFITATEIFITVAPYFGLSPNGVDTAISSQQNTIMQNVFISIVSFLIGASVGTRKKDDTIQTVVETAAKAQAALPPVPGALPIAPVVPVGPGESVTVKGEEAPKP